jgi:hypothetical protein
LDRTRIFAPFFQRPFSPKHCGLLARFDRSMARSIRLNSSHGWITDGAELLENGLGLRHSGDRAGADIRTDNAALGLPTQRRQAFLNKLDIPALTAADVSTDDNTWFSF